MTVQGTTTAGSGQNWPQGYIGDPVPGFYPEWPKPQINLSEGMIRRDNYFHSCWMELKFRRSDLASEMANIELLVSGYSTKEKSDAADDGKEINIL